METNELVKALRDCTNKCDCATCEYRNVSDEFGEKFSFDVLMDRAADRIEKQDAEIKALRDKVPEWIPVSERLPEPETEVLIVCNRRGCRFVCPAIYEDGKMLTQDSDWNWNDLYDYGTYSEDDDDYFVPQGWWEDRQFTPDDVYNNPVDCEVTHWMPLPELPEEEKHEK